MTLLQTMAHDRAQAIAQIKAQSQKVQQWYKQEYPDDEMAKNIDPDISFLQMLSCMKNGTYCYATFWADDSVIRERIFARMAKVFHVSYNSIYYLWLTGENVDTFRYRNMLPVTISVEPVSNIIVVEYEQDGEQKKDLYGTLSQDKKNYYMLPLDNFGQPTGQVWTIYYKPEKAQELENYHHYIFTDLHEAEWRAEQ